jgi:hypothetical protein
MIMIALKLWFKKGVAEVGGRAFTAHILWSSGFVRMELQRLTDVHSVRMYAVQDLISAHPANGEDNRMGKIFSGIVHLDDELLTGQRGTAADTPLLDKPVFKPEVYRFYAELLV